MPKFIPLFKQRVYGMNCLLVFGLVGVGESKQDACVNEDFQLRHTVHVVQVHVTVLQGVELST
jgi:hypothetical protein